MPRLWEMTQTDADQAHKAERQGVKNTTLSLPLGQDSRFPRQSQPRTPDPRRRPFNGAEGPTPFSLQDKRMLNAVPPLYIAPAQDMSLGSDSAMSDDVFVQNSTGPATAPPAVSAPELRRFSTGMLAHAQPTLPRILAVETSQAPESGEVTEDESPDDIYVDFCQESPAPSDRQGGQLSWRDGAAACESRSDAAEADDRPAVQCRHALPQDRDDSGRGEVTGEVFTVTMHKKGSRLGLGLIDGMHTPLKLPGIYVRNVLPGTPAVLCGHIRVGDRLLAINGRSIVGSDYHSAMKQIRTAGPRLNLMIAKCDSSVAASIFAA